MQEISVIFDVQHLYYLPQYLPVVEELARRNIPAKLVFYRPEEPELLKTCQAICESLDNTTIWVNDWNEAKAIYKELRPDWIIFGNFVNDIEEINNLAKSALMEHGIGPKACYYDVSKNQTTVRFVEGVHRLKRLKAMYPQGNFIDSGYAKLDPAFNRSIPAMTLAKMNLDPTKKTILYAPTFFPSSIESFPVNFPKDFQQYNIILKPHFFSMTKSRYKKQKRRIETWSEYDNVYLANIEEFNLIPFMLVADIMLSDASSAIFEFAALDKPVIWCNFYGLRWGYRGLFRFRLKQRMDQDISFFEKITYKTNHYREVKQAVENQLNDPNSNQQQRKLVTSELAGKTDGKCSARICDYLVDHAS
jgi:CDP-glycerol glycerophosphotransferase